MVQRQVGGHGNCVYDPSKKCLVSAPGTVSLFDIFDWVRLFSRTRILFINRTKHFVNRVEKSAYDLSLIGLVFFTEAHEIIQKSSI